MQDSTQALLKDFELQFVPTRKTTETVFGTHLEDGGHAAMKVDISSLHRSPVQ